MIRLGTLFSAPFAPSFGLPTFGLARGFTCARGFGGLFSPFTGPPIAIFLALLDQIFKVWRNG
jgi:hypothetical protein